MIAAFHLRSHHQKTIGDRAYMVMLVRLRVTFEHQNNSKKLPKQELDKWRGFLPKRVDALEFQQELRREWDDRGVSVSLTE